MLGEMLRESVETQFLGEQLGRGSEKGPKKGSFPSEESKNPRIQEKNRETNKGCQIEVRELAKLTYLENPPPRLCAM